MSVNLNQFGLSIISNDVKHIIKNNGKYHYFSLPNFSTYQIKLINNKGSRCDAIVSIDGENIGTWRIPSFSAITIQRPANINRKFVFVKEKSYTAKYTDIEANDPNNGLITVIFKPEAEHLCPYQVPDYIRTPTFYEKWNYGSDDIYDSIRQPAKEDDTSLYLNSSGIQNREMGINKSNSGYHNGATILGAGTDQNFNISSRIYKYDYSNITTINIRLIVGPRSEYLSIKQALGHKTDEPPVANTVYPPVYNLVDRYYDNDRVLIEKPYYT
jgi:hypothetical protein